MADKTSPESWITEKMMKLDQFSQWLGVEVLEVGPGSCTLRMTVRPEMCNGFLIAHGGITYSLADSALAFASNGRGRYTVSIETSISHLKPLVAGDTITATAEEKNLTKRTGLYEVKITNAKNELVALFKGTVFRKETEWAASE